jgi:hypothetical protein
MEILFELPTSATGVGELMAQATRTGNRYRLQVEESGLYAAMERLGAAGAKILSVTQIKPSLEEYFMHLVEADRAPTSAVEVRAK